MSAGQGTIPARSKPADRDGGGAERHRERQAAVRAARVMRWRARRLAIQACSAATVGAGVDARAIAGLGPDGLLILPLHSVSPRRAPFPASISPEALDRLLSWLRRHCRIGTIETLARTNGADGRPGAVLTFAAGYCDSLESAIPVLEAHAARAIVSVVPACVDSGAPPWNL